MVRWEALSAGLVVAVAMAAVPARPARACTCTPRTAQQLYDGAQHVFIARASAPEVSGPSDKALAKMPRRRRWALLRKRTRSYTLKVLHVLKGKPGLAFSHMTRVLDGCARNFSENEVALVYVDKKNGIRLCDGNAGLSDIFDGRLPETMKIAGGSGRRVSLRDVVAALALGGVVERAPDSAKAYKRVRFEGRWAGKVGRFQAARVLMMARGKARDIEVHRVLRHVVGASALLFVEASTVASTTLHRLLVLRRGARRYVLLASVRLHGCAKRRVCRVDGACTARDGACVVGATADCRSSEGCKASGRCTARRGKCVLEGEADCRRSRPCVELGRCTALRGRCVVGGPADCGDARACKRRGHCTFDKKSAQCVVGSDADCRGSEQCTNQGKCRRKDASTCVK